MFLKISGDIIKGEHKEFRECILVGIDDISYITKLEYGLTYKIYLKSGGIVETKESDIMKKFLLKNTLK